MEATQIELNPGYTSYVIIGQFIDYFVDFQGTHHSAVIKHVSRMIDNSEYL